MYNYYVIFNVCFYTLISDNYIDYLTTYLL